MQNFCCENLSFYYGKKVILDNISFQINKGDIIALVGNNGSGKTTFLKLLAGIIKHHKFKTNYSVSFLIEDPAFYPYLSGEQNLRYFEMVYEKRLLNYKEALCVVGLQSDKDKKFQYYSYGMKERLAIAKCLLMDAQIYLFDEPLNGVDAKNIYLFRNIIKFLSDKGKIIIISSHILSELDKYCNKLFIIDEFHHLHSYVLEKDGLAIEEIFLGDVK